MRELGERIFGERILYERIFGGGGRRQKWALKYLRANFGLRGNHPLPLLLTHYGKQLE